MNHEINDHRTVVFHMDPYDPKLRLSVQRDIDVATGSVPRLVASPRTCTQKKSATSSPQRLARHVSPSPQRSSPVSVTESDTEQDVLKKMIKTTHNCREKAKQLEDEKKKVDLEIERLKEEVSGWMNGSSHNSIEWQERVICKTQKVKTKRIVVADLLETVERIYGEKKLDLVIAELDRIHTAHNTTDVEVRLVKTGEGSDSCRGRYSKRSRRSHVSL